MQLVHTIDEVRAQVKAWKQEGLFCKNVSSSFAVSL